MGSHAQPNSQQRPRQEAQARGENPTAALNNSWQQANATLVELRRAVAQLAITEDTTKFRTLAAHVVPRLRLVQQESQRAAQLSAQVNAQLLQQQQVQLEAQQRAQHGAQQRQQHHAVQQQAQQQPAGQSQHRPAVVTGQPAGAPPYQQPGRAQQHLAGRPVGQAPAAVTGVPVSAVGTPAPGAPVVLHNQQVVIVRRMSGQGAAPAAGRPVVSVQRTQPPAVVANAQPAQPGPQVQRLQQAGPLPPPKSALEVQLRTELSRCSSLHERDAMLARLGLTRLQAADILGFKRSSGGGGAAAAAPQRQQPAPGPAGMPQQQQVPPGAPPHKALTVQQELQRQQRLLQSWQQYPAPAVAGRQQPEIVDLTEDMPPGAPQAAAAVGTAQAATTAAANGQKQHQHQHQVGAPAASMEPADRPVPAQQVQVPSQLLPQKRGAAVVGPLVAPPAAKRPASVAVGVPHAGEAVGGVPAAAGAPLQQPVPQQQQQQPPAGQQQPQVPLQEPVRQPPQQPVQQPVQQQQHAIQQAVQQQQQPPHQPVQQQEQQQAPHPVLPQPTIPGQPSQAVAQAPAHRCGPATQQPEVQAGAAPPAAQGSQQQAGLATQPRESPPPVQQVALANGAAGHPAAPDAQAGALPASAAPGVQPSPGASHNENNSGGSNAIACGAQASASAALAAAAGGGVESEKAGGSHAAALSQAANKADSAAAATPAVDEAAAVAQVPGSSVAMPDACTDDGDDELLIID